MLILRTLQTIFFPSLTKSLMFLILPGETSEIWIIPDFPYSSISTKTEWNCTLVTVQRIKSPSSGKPCFLKSIFKLFQHFKNSCFYPAFAAGRLCKYLAANQAVYFCRSLSECYLLILAFRAPDFDELASWFFYFCHYFYPQLPLSNFSLFIYLSF